MYAARINAVLHHAHRQRSAKDSPLKTSSPDRLLARAGLAASLVVMVAVCIATPGESVWLPPCVFFKLTGLYCPGCGSTRMLFHLVHGHPLEALRYNALSLLALPFVLYSLVRKSFDLKLPALPRISLRWTTAFAFAVVFFSVARNIPAEPFCKLAPGGVCRSRPFSSLSSPRPFKNFRSTNIVIRLSAQTFFDKGYAQPTRT